MVASVSTLTLLLLLLELRPLLLSLEDGARISVCVALNAPDEAALIGARKSATAPRSAQAMMTLLRRRRIRRYSMGSSCFSLREPRRPLGIEVERGQIDEGCPPRDEVEQGGSA